LSRARRRGCVCRADQPAPLAPLRSSVATSRRPPATKPSRGAFRAFLRMHRPLTSMFGRRLLCLWGQFVGTYSALAYAACAGGRGRERPVHCGFAAKAWVGRSGAYAYLVHGYAVALLKVAAVSRQEDCGAEALHGARPVQPYAAALLSSTPWPAGCMELTWRSRILRRTLGP
jgi:hypothetical protein